MRIRVTALRSVDRVTGRPLPSVPAMPTHTVYPLSMYLLRMGAEQSVLRRHRPGPGIKDPTYSLLARTPPRGRSPELCQTAAIGFPMTSHLTT